ncbi:cytochrome b [Lichenicola cladoniae]|uniref:Cytochrome b n=1 Tax=Lichenicola cladoniae TaxID=1484109 RepID=A0A6M8HM58_9PROT|nr:cytochrome b [Lichenicola cladoniae]NPD66857.1 cytochrome b [Acetobacteraceae bacterium]QKE89417.1 cytochrome b [Lichenicola cladoniae]
MIRAGRYTRTAMALHWLVALLVIANLVLVWTIGWFPDALVRPAIDTHKSIGITVLGLALLRVLWRFSHRPPPLPAEYSSPERAAAHGAHILLYGLILALPLTGWIHDSAFKDAAAHPLRLFGLVPWPRIGPIMALDPVTKEHVHAVWFSIHGLLAYGLYVLLALHLLGVLKHQLFDREPVLKRMLPAWGSRRHRRF